MDNSFALLVCASCQTCQEYGNYCRQCGEKLSEVTVTPGMIHERTIPDYE